MSESQIFPTAPQTQASATLPRMNSLTKALVSVIAIVGGYYALGRTFSYFLGDISPGGYAIMWSTFATLTIAVGAMVWAVATGRGLGSLGFRRPGRIWLAVLQGVLIAPVMMVIVSPIAMFLMSLGFTSEMNFNPIAGPNIHIAFAIAMVTMWVNAALGEEVIFRGLLMNNVQRALGDGWLAGIVAAFAVAAPFGLLHYFGQGWYGVIITGSVGLLLGLFFLMTKRNIFPVFIAHGVFNSISFTALYLGQLQSAGSV
ncbi:MAG: CPBP family glutamic-type intramembrane protease [Oceanicaulis sp.]